MTDVNLGPLDAFPADDWRVFAIGEFEVGVFRYGEHVVAWENQCPHAGGPICQGKMFRKVDESIREDRTSLGLYFGGDHHVVCPWHGFEFNLETGLHPGDARFRLSAVPLTIRDSQVFVTLPAYAGEKA